MNEAGMCTLKKEGGMPYIEIKIREDRLNEDVVSHELLHAFNIKRGFGRSCANIIGDIPFGLISQLLHSVIEHQSIYKKQKAPPPSGANRLAAGQTHALVHYDTILEL